MESSSSNAAEVNVKILYVRGGWRKTKPKHEWRWERFTRIKRFCITYWETHTSSRKQTLNSCFQTQFLSLHILTCRLDISIVQRVNTWQLPHELFHCFSFFFLLYLLHSYFWAERETRWRYLRGKDMKRLRGKSLLKPQLKLGRRSLTVKQKAWTLRGREQMKLQS